MPRYIGVHPVAYTEEQLQPFGQLLPGSVIWNSTYVAVADNKTYCLWEAPTKEAMAEVFAKYEIPYEGIYEVRRFDPLTNTLEPEAVEVCPHCGGRHGAFDHLEMLEHMKPYVPTATG